MKVPSLGVGKWVERMFRDHKLVRRLSLAWVIWKLDWVIGQLFQDHTKITQWGTVAYATTAGLLTTILGLYYWLAARDQKWLREQGN